VLHQFKYHLQAVDDEVKRVIMSSYEKTVLSFYMGLAVLQLRLYAATWVRVIYLHVWVWVCFCFFWNTTNFRSIKSRCLLQFRTWPNSKSTVRNLFRTWNWWWITRRPCPSRGSSGSGCLRSSTEFWTPLWKDCTRWCWGTRYPLTFGTTPPVSAES